MEQSKLESLRLLLVYIIFTVQTTERLPQCWDEYKQVPIISDLEELKEKHAGICDCKPE